MIFKGCAQHVLAVIHRGFAGYRMLIEYTSEMFNRSRRELTRIYGIEGRNRKRSRAELRQGYQRVRPIGDGKHFNVVFTKRRD